MQIVQFQCGHCGKVMAVGSEHLGQQVRCPHCQQVVIAPPPSSAAPPPPAAPPQLVETILQPPKPAGDADDIFSQTEVSDDLFGRTEPPRIEMPPPEPLAPTLPGDPSVPAPQPDATLSSTLPYVPPSQATSSPSNGDGTAVMPSSEAAPWMAPTEMMTTPGAEAPPSFPGEAPVAGQTVARPPRRTESKVPWFMLLVFSPLLLYAIIITIFAALLYQQEQNVEEKLRQRFEYMPDEGDKPGVEKGKKVSYRWPYESTLPSQPLPDHLCTTLGQPLRIGDLQVDPVRVERKRMQVRVANYNPEPCNGDSLVLNLKLKNLSSEYAFAPLDNYFDRCWDGGERPPFTSLEVGSKHRFYGGPAKWYPLGSSKNPREWIEGRNNLPEVLQPGEEKQMFVCTNGGTIDCPAKETVAVLFGKETRPAYHGPFLWRIRVRRGLYRFKDKERSYTAVIGVRFTDKDVDAKAAVQ